MKARFSFLSFACLLIFSTAFSQKNAQEINSFIDAWHLAAAQANADVFFASMDDESVYIGTDASERWTKTAFEKFARPYFEKGKAWDFKPYDRSLHVLKNGKVVWFSELLTTWMGVCRGSGVLVKTSKGWKIEQYHLSVTVPNEIIKNFISLVEDYQKQSPRPSN